MSSSDSETSSSVAPEFGGLALHSTHAEANRGAALKEWRIAQRAIDWAAGEKTARAAVEKCSWKHKSFRELLNKRRRKVDVAEPSRLLGLEDGSPILEPVAAAVAVATPPVVPTDPGVATPLGAAATPSGTTSTVEPSSQAGLTSPATTASEGGATSSQSIVP